LIPKPCLHRNADRTGCPKYAEPGKSYCAEHRRVSPSGRVTQTSRWRGLRRRLIDSAPRPLTCAICLRVITDEKDVEVDHIKPVSEGGAPFDRANLRIVHRVCNRRVRRTPTRTRLAADRRG
jgi:5-methylcytosine-specific restriction endonuclease McrA